MKIESILEPERTVLGLEVSSKKKAIERAAEVIVESLPHLPIGDVYRGLIEREKLGSTAIGKGVAIPHCRLQGCSSIVGGLFVLDQAIDFGAPDDQDVQVLFVLLVPESETTAHLEALAMLAERFESDDYRRSLIEATSDTELFDRALQAPGSADDTAQMHHSSP